MKLSVDEIILIHDQIIEATGGGKGIREPGLLESISVKAFGSFGGEELYEGVFLKAAVIFDSLVNYHVFVDGNKRCGIAVLEYFLHKNGYVLRASKAEKEKFTLNTAIKNPDLADISIWTKKHSMKVKS